MLINALWVYYRRASLSLCKIKDMLKKIVSRLLYIILWIIIGAAFWFYSATDVFRWRLKQHYWRARTWWRIITGMATWNSIVSLTTEYPQYNWMDKNISLDDFDPVSVKLEVIARIASWTTAWKIARYYVDIKSPEKKIETQYTSSDTPHIYFTLKRVTWEYRFWVDIYDNQGNIITTSEWERPTWPTIFFQNK